MSDAFETTVPHSQAGEGAIPAIRVGRFVVLDRLGMGGMGVVYAAYDPELDRKVAIKLLRNTSADAEARTRMQREARAMARLSDPHVVAVYDVGVHEDQVFIAMELIKGRTLREWLSAPRSWREVIGAFVQAGNGLAAAHSSGIVHRDFKPENVLVASDERVRVTDFGLSRAQEPVTQSGEHPAVEHASTRAHDSALTEHGALVGTPAYMSPEQIMGRAADAKSDQFSYCVALWEALYGARPFVGETIVDLAIAIDEAVLPPPSDGSEVPAWLHAIMRRGLSREPADRYPTMAALLAAVAREPARRRLRVAAAVLAIGGAVGGGSWLLRDEMQRAACEKRATAVDEAWSPEIRARIAASFEATGASFHASTLAHVASRLDAYADEWRAAWRSTCDSTMKNMPEETRERSIACFEDRQNRLAELIAVMSDADIGVVRNATTAAWKLPDVKECGDARELERVVLLPDEPATRERVLDIRKRLARALTHDTLGRPASSLELLEALDSEAKETGWPPLVVEVDAELGRIAGAMDDHARSESTLLDAHLQATSIGAHRLIVDTATLLAFEIGDLQQRHDEGRVWGRLALAQLEHTGETDGYSAAGVFQVLGNVSQRSGRLPDAIDYLQRSLEIRERLLGEQHPFVGSVLQNLCNAYRDQGEYDRAQAACERGVSILEHAYGRDHKKVANTRLNLGRVLLARGRRDDAQKEFNESLRVLEQDLGPAHGEVALPLTGLAVVHTQNAEAARASGSPEDVQSELREALRLHQRALEIHKASLRPDHPYVIESVINTGVIYVHLGDYERALPLFRESASILIRTAPDAINTGIALANLGEVLLELHRAAEAVEPLEHAIRVFEAANADSVNLANTEFALAKALAATGEQAGEVQRRVASAAERYRQAEGDHRAAIDVIERWTAHQRQGQR